MARKVGFPVENNFINGLVTEATGLNFPESASTETYNCVFDRIGEVRRRLGFDFEPNHVFISETNIEPDLSAPEPFSTNSVIYEFVWESVDGDANLNFVVLQTGHVLSFYILDSAGNLSANKFTQTIDLRGFATSSDTDLQSNYCSFAAGNGLLFVAHPFCESFSIEYTGIGDTTETDTFVTTEINIEIRDLKGVDDGLDVMETPVDLTPEHLYNLRNQGWDVDGKFDKVGRFRNFNGVNPANNMIWWMAKEADDESYDKFDPILCNSIAFGNRHAPRGHYILSAFYTDRGAISAEEKPNGYSGLPIESSGKYRPTTIAFFAGRVFYAGVNTGDYGDRIYFSRIIEEDKHFGQCYQDNDPTSEVASDLLPSDGGIIRILGIGGVINLVTVGNSLIVFAANGIWAIQGSEGIGFTANDYSVRKISSIKTKSKISFIDAEGIPIWWTDEGIFVLESNEVGQIQIRSLSDETIKTFFEDEIPDDAKNQVRGALHKTDKIIYWTWRNAVANNRLEEHLHDRVLVFDTISNAFYPWKIDAIDDGETDYRLAGVINISGQTKSVQEAIVVTNDDIDYLLMEGDVNLHRIALEGDEDPGQLQLSGDADSGIDTVIETDGDIVIANNAVDVLSLIPHTVKYLTYDTVNQSITWSEVINTDYEDWPITLASSSGDTVIFDDQGSYPPILDRVNPGLFAYGLITDRGEIAKYDSTTGITDSIITIDLFGINKAGYGSATEWGWEIIPEQLVGILNFEGSVPSSSKDQDSIGITSLTTGLMLADMIPPPDQGTTDSQIRKVYGYTWGKIATDQYRIVVFEDLWDTIEERLILYVSAYDFLTGNDTLQLVTQVKVPESGQEFTQTGTNYPIPAFCSAMASTVAGEEHIFYVNYTFSDDEERLSKFDTTAGTLTTIYSHEPENNTERMFFFYPTANYIIIGQESGKLRRINISTGLTDGIIVDTGSGTFVNDYDRDGSVTVEEQQNLGARHWNFGISTAESVGLITTDWVGTTITNKNFNDPIDDPDNVTYSLVFNKNPNDWGEFTLCLYDDVNDIGPRGGIWDGATSTVFITSWFYSCRSLGAEDDSLWRDAKTVCLESEKTCNSYESYFETGYLVHGDAIRKFQTNYVQVYSRRIEGSSCFMYGMWDHSANRSSNRWSKAQQCYRDRANFDYTTTRLKVRGHGKAVHLRFESDECNPFHIIGWSIYETQNELP